MNVPSELPPTSPPQRSCEACDEASKRIALLTSRVEALEQGASRLREAFVKNDLGLPDYDGHRVAHVAAIERNRVVESYKRDMTKRVLEWLLVALAVILGQGFIDFIRGHLK